MSVPFRSTNIIMSGGPSNIEYLLQSMCTPFATRFFRKFQDIHKMILFNYDCIICKYINCSLCLVTSSFVDRDTVEIAINECNQDGDDDG